MPESRSAAKVAAKPESNIKEIERADLVGPLRTIQIVKGTYRNNTAGDICAYAEPEADQIVADGIAKYYVDPADGKEIRLIPPKEKK